MQDQKKDRNLDDFINELRKTADGRINRFKQGEQLLDHEYIQHNPDVNHKVESLRLQVEQSSSNLSELEDKFKTFSEHLTELTSIVSDVPGQMVNEVTHKVENFLTYHTHNIQEKLNLQEQKMVMERKKILDEFQKLSSQVKQQASQFEKNSILSTATGTTLSEALQIISLVKQEFMKDSQLDKKIEAELSSKLDRLEQKLNELATMNAADHEKLFSTSTPKWLYILNLVFLAGIFLFLLNHWVSNYQIRMRPRYSIQQPLTPQTNNITPSPIPEQQNLLPEYSDQPTSTSAMQHPVIMSFIDTVGLDPEINMDEMDSSYARLTENPNEQEFN